MRQARYHQFGSPEVVHVDEVQRPRPVDGEVLVKVAAAAVNPKDILIRKGKFKLLSGSAFPRTVGFDFSGIVVATGPGIDQSNEGHRVFGMLNGWEGGTCAEFVAVPMAELAIAPRGVSLMDAGGVPLVAQTALQALRDLGGVTEGDCVCINGASGGVGTMAIQIARILGSDRVTAVCSDKNSDLVTDLGAYRVVDYSTHDILEERDAFDVFFDVYGNRSFHEARPSLKRGGRYITTVPSTGVVLDRLQSFFTTKGARMVVVKSQQKDLTQVAEWLESKQLRPVTDRVMPLAEIAAAHAYVESGASTGKVVISVDPEQAAVKADHEPVSEQRAEPDSPD